MCKFIMEPLLLKRVFINKKNKFFLKKKKTNRTTTVAVENRRHNMYGTNPPPPRSIQARGLPVSLSFHRSFFQVFRIIFHSKSEKNTRSPSTEPKVVNKLNRKFYTYSRIPTVRSVFLFWQRPREYCKTINEIYTGWGGRVCSVTINSLSTVYRNSIFPINCS